MDAPAKVEHVYQQLLVNHTPCRCCCCQGTLMV